MWEFPDLSIFLLQHAMKIFNVYQTNKATEDVLFSVLHQKKHNLIIEINTSIIPAALEDFTGNCLIIHSLQTVFAKLLYCRYSLSPHGFQYEFRHCASGLNIKRRNEPLIMINKRNQRGLNMQLHYKALCSVWNNCKTDIKRRNWQHSLWVCKTLQQHRNR